MLRAKKGGAVHNWISLIDWASIAAPMLLWAVLIAIVGYAGALAAWHEHA
jgi:hypothetical protein